MWMGFTIPRVGTSEDSVLLYSIQDLFQAWNWTLVEEVLRVGGLFVSIRKGPRMGTDVHG